MTKEKDSILDSVKRLLGIDPYNTDFDTNIILFINSALASLVQMGIGPEDGYSITSNSETWSDFLGEDKGSKMSFITNYIYSKVKLAFDPPANTNAYNALKEIGNEAEFRLRCQKDQY